MGKMRILAAIACLFWLDFGTLASGNNAQVDQGEQCSFPHEEGSSIVNFGKSRLVLTSDSRYPDFYDTGSAAHTLMIFDPENITLDGAALTREEIPQRISGLSDRGVNDFAIKILIDETASFALVNSILIDLNDSKICKFSIRNMASYVAFSRSNGVPRYSNLIGFPEHRKDYNLVITTSDVRGMRKFLKLKSSSADYRDCTVYYWGNQVDSTEFEYLLEKRAENMRSSMSDLLKNNPGFTEDDIMSRSIILQAPGRSPWRCVAGVLWNVKYAGYPAATLRVMPG